MCNVAHPLDTHPNAALARPIQACPEAEEAALSHGLDDNSCLHLCCVHRPPADAFVQPVAVECIFKFSSSTNTISTHHASLQPETIRMLMVLKHPLHQVCEGSVIALE